MRRLLIGGIGLLLIIILFCLNCKAHQHAARVIGITDGDTIKVVEDNALEKIRLRGIDCPEKGQPFGKQAKLLTAQLAFGKDVVINDQGRDRYGRIIADVILPDKTSLSCDLVKAGYAWWYRQYAPDDYELASLEREARRKNLGLWSAPTSVPPWEFRRHRMVPEHENQTFGQERTFFNSSTRAYTY